MDEDEQSALEEIAELLEQAERKFDDRYLRRPRDQVADAHFDSARAHLTLAMTSLRLCCYAEAQAIARG